MTNEWVRVWILNKAEKMALQASVSHFQDKSPSFYLRYTFKLVNKNQIEGARAPWNNIIVGGPFKLEAI